MAKSARYRLGWMSRHSELWMSSVITALALLMFIPFHTALSAGLASLSLVIFSSCLIVLLFMLRGRSLRGRVVLAGGLAVAGLGMIVPQLAYIQTASQHQATLQFDPLAYVTFSGQTSLTPTRLYTYTPGKQLALYSSNENGPRPVVVLLHGGGWRYGNYLETGLWPNVLTNAGYTVISIEYPLSSDTTRTWQTAPASVHTALTYIQDNADQLSIDPGSIHLFGQSAGGHLALLEAYSYNQVRSVVSLYAPVDLNLDYQTSRDPSAELDFIGGSPTRFPERYESLSPLTKVSGVSPPTLIVQGETDDLVATQNALVLRDALTQHGINHELLLLPMTGHSFENQRGGFASQITTQAVLRFLAEQ